MQEQLSPAALAFDAVAQRFDARYGEWKSVSAQRRAVRDKLSRMFPRGSRLLEVGGGTGEDALWLTQHGREVLLTDVSPSMVRIAAEKLLPAGAPEPLVYGAERLDLLADRRAASGAAPFDGAFSNFAGLNCVTDLRPVAHGLARLVHPGGQVALVIFGTLAVGEWVVQLSKGSAKHAFRRFDHGDVHARLGGQDFTVRYHRASDVQQAFAPWFNLVSRTGIGVFVPPSAAEPSISRYPRIVDTLERLDRLVARPLAALGDHVLYQLARNATPVE